MASNTKITRTRRKNRDQKQLRRRQVGLKKKFQAAQEIFNKIFAGV